MSDKRSHLVLIGFMGSGKTTIGQILAHTLNRPFIDLDSALMKSEKMSISEIFEQKGESYFRKAESKLLQTTLKSKVPAVISTGGGAPCFHNGIEYINQSSYAFYLKVGRTTLFDRIYMDKERPLVKHKTKKELKQFIDRSLKEREEIYKLANQTILAFAQPQSIVDRILKYLEKEKI